jgi:flagellar FliL protein
MSQAPETPAAAEPKKKRSKLVTLVVPLVVVLAGGGGGAWWYLQQQQPAEAAEEKPKTPSGMLPFDAFVVNLADPGGRRFLRVSLLLLVPTEPEALEISENELEMSRIRSALIELLSTRTSAQLASHEGRSELKTAIAETASKIGHVEVIDVLFKEFVVQ